MEKMGKIAHAISWFEIPVDDFERARMFYSAIFDYEMPTTDMGPKRMGFLPFDEGKGIGGAIVKGDGYLPAREGTLVYLAAGDDLSTVLMRVEAACGKVLTEKTEVAPGLGYYAHLLDSEGNKVSLHSQN